MDTDNTMDPDFYFETCINIKHEIEIRVAVEKHEIETRVAVGKHEIETRVTAGKHEIETRVRLESMK